MIEQTTAHPYLERIEALERRVAELEAKLGTLPDEPPECRSRECSYWTGYLAYGPKELEHEGFHAAEKQYLEHVENCPFTDAGRECGWCLKLEKLVRA